MIRLISKFLNLFQIIYFNKIILSIYDEKRYANTRDGMINVGVRKKD